MSLVYCVSLICFIFEVLTISIRISLFVRSQRLNHDIWLWFRTRETVDPKVSIRSRASHLIFYLFMAYVNFVWCVLTDSIDKTLQLTPHNQVNDKPARHLIARGATEKPTAKTSTIDTPYTREYLL